MNRKSSHPRLYIYILKESPYKIYSYFCLFIVLSAIILKVLFIVGEQRIYTYENRT